MFDRPLSFTAMNPATLQRLILLFSFLSPISTLPSNTQERRSLAPPDTLNIAKPSSDSPLSTQPHPVTCLSSRLRPLLAPADCAYVINNMLLREDGVFEERSFANGRFEVQPGVYARARWQYGQCLILVSSRRGVSQSLSFFDVAFTANRIIQQCVWGVESSKGGTSLIGDATKTFVVDVEGFLGMGGGSVNVTSIDQQPAVNFSKRVLGFWRE